MSTLFKKDSKTEVKIYPSQDKPEKGSSLMGYVELNECSGKKNYLSINDDEDPLLDNPNNISMKKSNLNIKVEEKLDKLENIVTLLHESDECNYKIFSDGIAEISAKHPEQDQKDPLNLSDIKEWIENIETHTRKFQTSPTKMYFDPPNNCGEFSNSGRYIIHGNMRRVVLKSLADGNIKRIYETNSLVTSLCFSSENHFIAVGCQDGSLYFFDTLMEKEIFSINKHHQKQIKSVKISKDDNFIITGSKDGTMKIISVEMKENNIFVFKGHEKSVRSVDFSPNLTMAATGSSDNKIIIFEIKSTTPQLEVTEYDRILTHQEPVRGIAFSPDSTMLLSGSLDKSMRLFKFLPQPLADPNKKWVELYKFTECKAPVQSVAFSRDQKKVISGGKDKTIMVYDIKVVNYMPISGFSSQVNNLAICGRSNKVLAVGRDKSLRVYDINNGNIITNWSSGGIRSLVFSPDGKKLLSGTEDGTVKLFEVRTGRIIFNNSKLGKAIYSVAYSPNGFIIAAGCADSKIYLLDPKTGEVRSTITDHKKAVRSVTFSPDSKRLLSGSDDNTIKIFKIEPNQKDATLSSSLSRHKDYVTSVAFSPDGLKFLTGSSDKKVKLHDDRHPREIATFENHTEIVRAVAFSYNGKLFATGSYDKTAVIYETETQSIIHTLTGHTEPVLTLSFSPDAKTLLTGSGDNYVFLYSVETGQILRRFKGESKEIRSVVYSPCGNMIVSGSLGGAIRIYNINPNPKSTSYLRSTDTIRAVAVSPDFRRILSGGDDCILRLHKYKNAKLIRSMKGHNDWISSVAFSPDGLKGLTGSGDRTVRLFCLNSGMELRIFKGHSEWIGSVSFSRDGLEIISGAVDRTIIIFNTITGEKYKQYPIEEEAEKKNQNDDDVMEVLRKDDDEEETVQGGVRAVCFTNDEKYFLAAGEDKLIRKYDIKSGREVGQFKGHGNTILSISISARDEYLVSGSEDKTVKLFNMIDYKSLMTFVGHDSGVNSVCFSKDASKFVSAGDDGMIFIVERETGILLKMFAKQEQSIYSIIFSKNDKHVVYAGEVPSVKISHSFTKKELPFDYLSSKPSDLAFSKDGELVAAASGESFLNIFETRFPKIKYSFNVGEGKVNCVRFLTKKRKVISSGEETFLKIFNLEKTKETLEQDSEEKLKVAAENSLISEEKTVPEWQRVDTSDVKIGDMDMNLNYEEDNIEMNLEKISVFACSDDDLFVICGSEEGKLSIKKLDPDYKSRIVECHTSRINSIQVLSTINKNDMTTYKILTGGDDFKIHITDLHQGSVTNTFVIHQAKVTAVVFSPDYKTILSGSEDKSIRLFEVETGTELRSFTGHNDCVLSVNFSSDGTRVISSSCDKSLKVFDIESGFELDTMKIEDEISCVAASPISDSIVIGTVNGIQFVSRIFNSSRNLTSFSEFVNSDNKNANKSSLDLKAKDLSILPYPLKLTKLHYMIAFMDCFTVLENVTKIFLSKMREDRVPFLENCIFRKDSNELTPWDYWMNAATDQSKSPTLGKLIQIITSRYINGIENMSNKDVFIGEIIADFPSKLSFVLDAFMKDPEEITLPRSSREHLPIIACDTPNPCEELIRKIYKNELKLQEESRKKSEFFIVELKVCQLTPRELEGLLERLGNFVPSHPLFKSRSLVLIIEYLWEEYTRKSFFILFIKYLCFLSIVCINTFWIFPSKQIYPNTSRDLASKILDIVLIVILLIYMFALVKRYLSIEGNMGEKFRRFGTAWTLLELSMIIFGIVANGMDLIWNIGYNSEDFILSIKIISSIFFYISWMRLLDFARGFKITSALIRLLSRVAYDMFGFLLVFFLMLLGMALTTFLLQKNYDLYNPWEYFQKFYFMLLGDFQDYKEAGVTTGINQDLYFCILLAVTVLIVIVMLNLLIAIISDSFEKVMALEKQAEVFEKLQLIIERKRRMKRKTGYDQMVYLCELRKDEKRQGENLEERIRAKIDKIEKAQEFNEKNNKEIRVAIDNLHKYHQSNHSEILKIIKSLQEEFSDFKEMTEGIIGKRPKLRSRSRNSSRSLSPKSN